MAGWGRRGSGGCVPGLMGEESRTWCDSPLGLTPFCPNVSAGKGVTATKASVMGLPRKGSVCHAPESRNHRPATASPRASLQSLVQPWALQPCRKHPAAAGADAGGPAQWGTPAGSTGGGEGAGCGVCSSVRALQHAHLAVLPPGRRAGASCLLLPPEGDPCACELPGNTVQEQQQAALLQRR